MSAFGDDVLGHADAVEVAHRIAAREVQPREAVEAAILRAERVNPLLNAIATPLFDSARHAAAAPRPGPLSGVPTFIKDSDAVEGAPMRFGSDALPTEPVQDTSAFVEQFLATGVVNLGKTTTPEFGLTGTTEARVYGATHNPWRLGFSPGGSSGGSAALVAAGVVPIAHASDAGGSIRIPAACCGLVGLKPSRGRFANVEGSGLLPVKILHQGMVSRSVRDTAAFYRAAELDCRNARLPEIGSVTRPARQLRIGFFTEVDQHSQAHPECVAAVYAAVRLCEQLGHRVDPVRPPFDNRFHEDFFLLWSTMAFAVVRFGRRIFHRDFDRTKVDAFTEGLARHGWTNVRNVPGALLRLRRFSRRYLRFFAGFDVLMSPTLAMPPPEHGFLGPEVPFETAIERLRRFAPFTPLQNVSGAPAISLPLGRSEAGLPIGVQLAAAMGGERTLLELALGLEEAAPWETLAG